LNLRRNKLTSLPAELGELPKLKHLDVSGNDKLPADGPQTAGEFRDAWARNFQNKTKAAENRTRNV